MWFSYSPDKKASIRRPILPDSAVCYRRMRTPVLQWPDNGSRLLGSCSPKDPRCTRPHPVSSDGRSPEADGHLYTIEANIRGMPTELRLAERQRKTKPLLKSQESWLREKKMKTLSRHSELTKAFSYAFNQWPALTYYADDGWAEAYNNIAENACGRSVWVVKTSCSSALTMVVSGEHCCTA